MEASVSFLAAYGEILVDAVASFISQMDGSSRSGGHQLSHQSSHAQHQHQHQHQPQLQQHPQLSVSPATAAAAVDPTGGTSTVWVSTAVQNSLLSPSPASAASQVTGGEVGPQRSGSAEAGSFKHYVIKRAPQQLHIQQVQQQQQQQQHHQQQQQQQEQQQQQAATLLCAVRSPTPNTRYLQVVTAPEEKAGEPIYFKHAYYDLDFQLQLQLNKRNKCLIMTFLFFLWSPQIVDFSRFSRAIHPSRCPHLLPHKRIRRHLSSFVSSASAPLPVSTAEAVVVVAEAVLLLLLVAVVLVVVVAAMWCSRQCPAQPQQATARPRPASCCCQQPPLPPLRHAPRRPFHSRLPSSTICNR